MSTPTSRPAPVLPRTLCSALPETPPGSEVLLRGWVHRRRELASVAFLVVRDRSGLAQVVVRDDRERLAALPEETTVEVRGPSSRTPPPPAASRSSSRR